MTSRVGQTGGLDPGIAALRARFTAEMRKAAGHCRRLSEAFRRTDRADFVPTYLLPAPRSRDEWPVTWQRLSRDDGMPWAEHLYSADTALVIKLDGEGYPASSSTAPWLMAAMTTALRPPVGGRILEIGAGTGYNAAILSHLVGPAGSVISAELDDELCHAAASRLSGYANVSVLQRDGTREVVPPRSCDGILVTADAAGVEASWLSQLKPGGRLVVNLSGPMASGLFAGAATDRGSVQGRYLDADVGFTPLRGRHLPPDTGFDTRLISTQDQIPPGTEPALAAQAIATSRSARAFSQFTVAASKSEYMIVGSGGNRPGMLFSTGHQRCWVSLAGTGSGPLYWAGDEPLLDALTGAYRAWVAAGAPALSSLELEIGTAGTEVRVGGQVVCRSPLFSPRLTTA